MFIKEFWKIYRLDWVKFVHVGRFQVDSKGYSGIFGFLKCIVELIKVKMFAFSLFWTKFQISEKKKISKSPAYPSCITLKSTDIDKFGLTWLTVLISIFQIWSAFFSQIWSIYVQNRHFFCKGRFSQYFVIPPPWKCLLNKHYR